MGNGTTGATPPAARDPLPDGPRRPAWAVDDDLRRDDPDGTSEPVGKQQSDVVGRHGTPEPTATGGPGSSRTITGPDDGDRRRRAIHLARAREDRQASATVPHAVDPELCDEIVQQLFAVGMALRATQRRCAERPELAERIGVHLTALQDIIVHIRNAGVQPRTRLARGPAPAPAVDHDNPSGTDAFGASAIALPAPGRPGNQPSGRSEPGTAH